MLRFLILLSLCCTALAEPTQQAPAETNNFYLQQQIKQATDVASIKQQVTTQTDQLKKIAEELDAQKTQITELSQQQKVVDEQFNYQGLRKELLDRQQESIDWWWTVIGIFLAIVALIIPLLTRNYIKNLKEQIENAQDANILASEELDKIKAHSFEAEKIKQQMSDEWIGITAEQPNKEIIEKVKNSADVSYLDKEIIEAYELQDKKDIDGAIVQWQQILGVAKFDQDVFLQARAYFDIGYLLQEYKQENQKAIEAYQKAIELNPKHSEAYNNLGNIYLSMGQSEKALEAVKQALNLKPNFVFAYNTLGTIYIHLNEIDKALEAYQRAIELNPHFSLGFYNLGVTYGDLKENQKAIDTYNRAIDLDPENELAYCNLFEIQLISLGELNPHLKKQFVRKFTDKKALIRFEMLGIFEQVFVSLQPVLVQEKDRFKNKFSDVTFGNWSWRLIENWIEEQDPNDHLKDALEFFKTFDKKDS